MLYCSSRFTSYASGQDDVWVTVIRTQVYCTMRFISVASAISSVGCENVLVGKCFAELQQTHWLDWEEAQLGDKITVVSQVEWTGIGFFLYFISLFSPSTIDLIFPSYIWSKDFNTWVRTCYKTGVLIQRINSIMSMASYFGPIYTLLFHIFFCITIVH